MKTLVIALFLFWSALSFADSSSLQIYDTTTDLITKKFYDQTFRGLDWPKLVQTYRQSVTPTSDSKQLQSAINGLLENLHASHTEFITADDQEYHGLKCIFSGEISGDRYFQSGGWFQKINNKYYVRNIFANTPMEKSGIKTGDEIISADGDEFTEIQSFNKSTPVVVQYRHQADGPILTTTIQPQQYSVQELMLESAQASKKILNIKNKKVGYFHLWSGTNDAFLHAMQTAVSELANSTDALILDFRDGFGGAWTPYIQQFFNHDLDTGASVTEVYTKPVYILINDGVRSGKEYISLIMKKEKRATLVGTNTAGHVLAGAWFPIVDNKYSLFLAVSGDPSDVLEGVGVAPDIKVESPLPYSNGSDLQLDAVLNLIRKQ